MFKKIDIISMCNMKTNNINTIMPSRVVKRNGQPENVSFDKILRRIEHMATGDPDVGQPLNNIDSFEIAKSTIASLRDMIHTYELDLIASRICGNYVTSSNEYAILAARIAISNHHKSTRDSFSRTMKHLDELTNYGWLSRKFMSLVDKYAERLDGAIDYRRDFKLGYFGFSTLQRSYLLTSPDKSISERPQHMYMRIALFIHGDDIDRVLESYHLMSDGYFTHASPTIFNAGSEYPQLSSCFLLSMDDSIDGIYGTLLNCARISKRAGGIGINVSNVRARGSYIQGTNGTSDGLVNMLRVYNSSAVYVNQGGRRKGSFACFCKDTEVLTMNKGVKKIQDVKIGDLVVTHKNRIKPVLQVHKNPLEERKIYKLSVQSNKDIYVTGNHKFLSFYTKKYKNNKLSLGWNSIEELKTLMDNPETTRKTCYICTPTGTDIENTNEYKIDVMDYENAILNEKVKRLENNNGKVIPISSSFDRFGNNKIDKGQSINRIWNITENLANLFGIWLGNGNIRKSHGYILGIQFTVHNDNNQEIEFIKNVCQETFGCNITSDIPKDRNIEYINVNSHIVGTIFNDLFGCYFDGKYLPNMVFTWPKKLVNNLIAGLITADGHIAKTKYNATLGLSNKYLINQIYHLCRNNGITASFVKYKKTKGMTTEPYSMSITMNTDILDGTHKLYIDDRIQKCRESLIKNGQDGNDKYLKILEISETNRTDNYVYTLGVEDDHSYTVEGLIAQNCYIEPWHADIMSFLELRKAHGNQELRAQDLFYALWIPDLFMKRLKQALECNRKYKQELDKYESGKQPIREIVYWSVMCPNECPGLYNSYGKEFEQQYLTYEREGLTEMSKPIHERRMKCFSQIDIMDILSAITSSIKETGIPYVLYKDHVNHKNNQSNLGTINNSNLCAEIVEYNDTKEHAVCNLGSVVLNKFANSENRSYDFESLYKTCKVLFRNLDRVIDINLYPTVETRRSNMRHRPVGLGVQGLADTFYLLKYTFGSPEALRLNRQIFETIYYACMTTSHELAVENRDHLLKLVHESPPEVQHELNQLRDKWSTYLDTILQQDASYIDFIINSHKNSLSVQTLEIMYKLLSNYVDINDLLAKTPHVGAYSTFKGSPISNGQFQFDLWNEKPDPQLGWDWESLRQKIVQDGVRNSLTTCVMPTASTAQILGNSECIEPSTYQIYTRRTLSGEFILTNRHLERDLKALGLWDRKLSLKILKNRGSIQDIPHIPQDIKNVYRNSFEIKQRDLIDLARSRAPFIDQTQSCNIFLPKPTDSKITSIMIYTWEQGLKTGAYYWRREQNSNAIQFSLLGCTDENEKNNKVDEESECLACSA